MHRSREVLGVRAGRGVCGFHWDLRVRGLRLFRSVRRICGVRGDGRIRGANGVRGCSVGVGFLRSVGLVGSEGSAGFVGSGGVRGEVRGVIVKPSRPWSRCICGAGGSVGLLGVLEVRGVCGVWGFGASSGASGVNRVFRVLGVQESMSLQGSSGLWRRWVNRCLRIADIRGNLGVLGLRDDPRMHRKCG